LIPLSVISCVAISNLITAQDELEKNLRAKIELRNTLDRKKTELKNRIRSTADQAINEAKQQGQQAVQDILQGNTPSPSLPGIPNPFRR